MTRAAPTSPASKEPRPIPGRIGAVLHVLAVLIGHARHFAATAVTRAAVPEFATAAAVFGTSNLPTILHRMQRGMLRALALRDYLLARAARGRNLRFAWPPRVELLPHHRPPVGPARRPRAVPLRPRRPEPALLDSDNPDALRLPTAEELAAEVRSRPIGRTMTYICLDLGIVPGFCEGEFWNRVEKTLRRYGGSLGCLYRVRGRREETYQRERDRRPDTWHIDWRDLRPSMCAWRSGVSSGKRRRPLSLVDAVRGRTCWRCLSGRVHFARGPALAWEIPASRHMRVLRRAIASALPCHGRAISCDFIYL